jgi:hypothetical protein
LAASTGWFQWVAGLQIISVESDEKSAFESKKLDYSLVNLGYDVG